MRHCLFAGLVLGLCATGAWAQVILEDDFEVADPCASGDWICYGSTRWVSVDDPLCPDDESPCAVETFDHSVLLPTDPQCNLFEVPVGYVLVTPDDNDEGGSMFLAEPREFSNFKLTAEVELRGGDGNDRPADGMCIVIIGDAGNGPPAATGNLGGGMGAPGLADTVGPMLTQNLIFEFDNWDCNGSDQPGATGLRVADENHVAFHYSPDGFVRTDDFQKNSEAGVPSNDAIRSIGANPSGPPRMNGVETCTPSGAWLFEVFVIADHDAIGTATVACNVTNTNVAFPKTRMYTHRINDYEAFQGYIGVTASTGGANQNHILHSIKVETLPNNFCLNPPFSMDRDITSPSTDRRQVTPANPSGVVVAVWKAGDVVDVALTLSNIRVNNPPRCATPSDVTLSEVVPAGWTASMISDGGSFNAGTSTVTWNLGPATITEGKKLTYKVTAVDNTHTATWQGRALENFAGAEPVAVGGDSSLEKNSPFTACGGIRLWNILGPYQQPGFNAPDAATMAMDYMTDGNLTELDFLYFPGNAIETDFGGASFSQFLLGNANGWNPGGVPTTIGWSDLDDFININDDIYGGDPNDCMAYAQCYVVNTTAADIEAFFGVSSDDSVQVILNEVEVWTHTIPRGGADACSPQDVSEFLDWPVNTLPNDPVILEPGDNELIVKTFEGGGGFNFAFRFQDENREPVTNGLNIRLKPTGFCTDPPFTATRTIDTGANVVVQCATFPTYNAGEDYDNNIAISDVRGVTADCQAAIDATVVETVPAGWPISNVVPAGSVNGNVITWNLTAPFPPTLTYRVQAVGSATEVAFGGTIDDSRSEGLFSVGGNGLLFKPTDSTDDGFVKNWLLLSALRQKVGFGWGAAPSITNMQMDFLTDGAAVNEVDVEPEAGDTVNTAFNGASPSLGLAAAGAGSCSDVTIPTWKEWRDRDALINFNDFYGGNIDQIMEYAVFYVNLAQDTPLDIVVGTDDAVQVLLDGAEIWINSIARPIADDTITAATTPALNPLTEGCHKVMVKVFEGGGDHSLRLRFQDPVALTPILPGEDSGLTLSLDPSCAGGVETNCTDGADNDGDGETDCADSDCAPQPICQQPRLVRGDSNADGRINITDPIYSLAFSFQGGPPPPCRDAADADDSFGINITDPIFLLSFLFQGGPRPPAPSPSSGNYVPGDCGVDTTADNLDCLSFPPCN